ncbi:MAG: hypothetical protein EP329_14800 [Deltaproteobacteria bacterium]|nr:MAG: hypothetical protein EP329_14800 [Deltaproteobacteria bacterium]
MSYSASLAECAPGAETAALDGPAPRGLLAGLVGASPARAGHGGLIDPSITDTPRVEALAVPGLTDLGTVTFPETDYCRLHWVAGAASDHTAGLPDEVDLLGTTLWLEGTWTAPGTADAIPFVWSSPIANGLLTELADDLVAPPIAGSSTAEIRIVRELDRWFDGIDFAALSEDDIGRALMIGLATSTVVEVRLIGGDGG